MCPDITETAEEDSLRGKVVNNKILNERMFLKYVLLFTKTQIRKEVFLTMQKVSRNKMERTILLTLSAMTLWGYAGAETITTATVIQQPNAHLTDKVEVTDTNPTGSGATLGAVTVSSEANGGTVSIESPSITGNFISGLTLAEADKQTAALGFRIQNGYTGTVEVGSGTQITLNGQGNNFSGSALGIQSNTAQVQLGDGVGLTYTYSNQNQNGVMQNGSVLYNAGSTVSTGQKLTIRADTGTAGGVNTVGLFNTQGGRLNVGDQANIQVRSSVMQNNMSDIVYGIQSGHANEQNQRNIFNLGKSSQVKAEMDGKGTLNAGSLSAIQLWHSDFSLGENLQTETLLKGWTNMVNGISFHDAKGTIGQGLVNQVETGTMKDGTAPYGVSLVGIRLDQGSQVTLGDGSRNQVTVGANGSSLVAGMQILDGSVLDLGNSSHTEVTVKNRTWNSRAGQVAGAAVQDEGSLLKGSENTAISVDHDADNYVNVAGLYAQNKGSIQLGDHTTVQVSSAQASVEGISAAGGTVELGNQASLTVTAAKNAVAEGIFTQQEGGKTTLGDGAQVKATAKEGAMALGVYADKSGGNQIGSGAVLDASSETDRSMALAATKEGTNRIGDGARIQASSQRNDAYGTYAQSYGKNILGEGAVVSASSETGAATGIFTDEGSTVLGNHASVTAAGETAYGVNSLAGNTTLGDYASIYAKGNTAYGVASQYTLINGTGDDGNPVTVGVSGVNQVGAGAQIQAISTTGFAYGVYSDYGHNNNIGVNRIGAGSQIQAISTGENANAYGVYAVQGGSNEIGAGAEIQAVSTTGDAFGVYSMVNGSNEIGAKSQIRAISTGGDAYGVYTGTVVKSLHVGENSSISVSSQSGKAAGIYNGSDDGCIDVGNGVDITANGNQGIGVYAVNAVNFLGAARISGGQYSLYSGTGEQYYLYSKEGGFINLTAGGTKIISGDMLAYGAGVIDVVMDTGDSLFTGAAVELPYKSGDDDYDADYNAHHKSEIDISMSNGARWDMTGDSKVTNFKLNSGAVVNMTANPKYQTLTVDNFSGNDGIFYMKSDLDSQAADQSDKVAITTAAAGSSGKIQVSDASFARGSEVTGTRHQLLVTDASENATFTGEKLDTGGLWDVTPTIENGLNVYDEAGNVVGTKDQWYLTKLTKTVNDDTRPLVYSGDSTYAMYRRSIDTLRQRRGNLRQRGKTDDDGGIWARSRGGRMEGAGWDSRYNIFQLGYEYSDTPGSVYGFFGERGIASPDYKTGSGKEHTLAGGIYGTWYGRHGRYTDIVAKIGRDDTTVNTYGPYPDKANYRTGEQSLSIEHGRTLYRGKDKSFFIEPQVQLVLGHLNDTSYTTERGTHVERDSLNSAIGRLGIVLGKTKDSGEHPYDYYLKASLLHEFGGSQDIHMRAANGETLDTDLDYGETWVEVGLGGTYRFNASTMAYADIGRSYSSNLTEKWQINAGITWQF